MTAAPPSIAVLPDAGERARCPAARVPRRVLSGRAAYPLTLISHADVTRSPVRSAPRAPRGLALALACLAVSAVPARAQGPAGLTLDDVLRTTLEANADIRAAAWSVERQAAGVRVARGAFDPQVTATMSSEGERSPQFGAQNAPGIQSSSTLTYGLGMDQPFRSGLVVSPSLSFSRADAVGQALGPRNQAVASVGFTMPLLRGRGGGLAVAGERAAVMLHSELSSNTCTFFALPCSSKSERTNSLSVPLPGSAAHG